MIQTCKNCKQNFEITDEEINFYNSIGVPLPEACLNERLIEIMAFRNENKLYPRKCSATGDNILSAYQSDTIFPVYKNEIWWGDSWDALEYGRDIDFDRNFFDQLIDLQKVVPREGTSIFNSENCEYNSHIRNSRNCYLNSLVANCEDVYYSHWVVKNKDLVDCLYMNDSELCYECIDCYDLYNCFVLQESTNCSDCFFSYQIRNCKNCILCTNLESKSFYILNKEVSEEQFNDLKSKILNGSYKDWTEFHKKFLEIIKNAKHRFVHSLNSENSNGDHIYNSKNCNICFDTHGCEDCFNSASLGDSKNIYDSYSVGWPGSEFVYRSCVVRGCNNVSFCNYVWFCSDLKYCDSCISCQNCFGCVGLKHKSYCILNKQYTKEDYEKFLQQVIKHMQNTKQWGEYPPQLFSTFAYNETAAHSYFPLSKKEAISKGFKWSDYEVPFPKVEKIILANLIPDSIDQIPDDILNWAISCEITDKPFKIIKAELNFYRKMNLPIPYIHPDERHNRRMKLRNPRKLFDRNCIKCNTEIKTTYSPERTEIIYCENCYLNEIY